MTFFFFKFDPTCLNFTVLLQVSLQTGDALISSKRATSFSLLLRFTFYSEWCEESEFVTMEWEWEIKKGVCLNETIIHIYYIFRIFVVCYKITRGNCISFFSYPYSFLLNFGLVYLILSYPYCWCIQSWKQFVSKTGNCTSCSDVVAEAALEEQLDCSGWLWDPNSWGVRGLGLILRLYCEPGNQMKSC